MRMNILTAYYYICADILKEHLPCIPELKLTNAKGYWGKIHKTDNDVFTRIDLSKFNLYVPENMIEQEDINDIIFTICHEFAHMLFWEHGENHTKATKLLKTIVKSNLNIDKMNRKLDLLESVI